MIVSISHHLALTKQISYRESLADAPVLVHPAEQMRFIKPVRNNNDHFDFFFCEIIIY